MPLKLQFHFCHISVILLLLTEINCVYVDIYVLQQLLKKTKENINPTVKHFSEFQKSRTQNIISSFDSKKSVGPNSIPTKILNLLKNDISSQLADIFNISFSTGVF